VTTLHLAGAGGNVPYYLREGLARDVRSVLEPHVGGGCFVVSDGNVGPLYGHEVAEQLDAPFLDLPAGEEHKNWESAERIVRWLLGWGVERRHALVAVGGGVVTDLVGFAASVTLRGLPWVAVPTTLLAMVDAAVGGKTGIDLDLGKNLVGTFWPPTAVAADPLVLRTLDSRQLRAGLVEVIKIGLIAPATFEHVLDLHLRKVASGRIEGATELIAAAVRIKAEVVSLDEREAGQRAALNLGHTLGHALEGATGYRTFLHGEAVGWGVLAALRLARDRGLLATTSAQAWATRLAMTVPWPPLAEISWQDVAPYLSRDKKRVSGRIGWVLPRVGGVILDVQVEVEEVEAIFRELQSLSPIGPFTVLF